MLRFSLFFLPLLAVGATVSNVTFVAVEHTSAQIRFDVSAAYTDWRIRYIASPGTCTDGSSGVVNNNTDFNFPTSGKRVNISGLTSAGVYQVCPEVYDGSWSSGVGATLTLAASPAVSPDPPVAPTSFSTAMPDISSCTVRAAANCGEFQTKLTEAKNNQATGCSVVTLPDGTSCDATTEFELPGTAESDPFWVYVMPAGALTELPPAGVRITPEWASKMITINLPSAARWLKFGGSYYYALNVGLGGTAPKKWRLIGIRWTHDDTGTPEITDTPTTDPHGYFGWVYMDTSAQDIIFDRNVFQGRGYPNRVGRTFVAFEGTRSAIVNSYFTNIDWWHSYTESTFSRTDATHIAVGAGDYHNGPTTWEIPATTVTITGGTATGRGAFYVDMSGNLTAIVPGDVTASCSPACTVVSAPLASITSATKGTTTILTAAGHGITAPSARILIAGSSWTGMHYTMMGKVSGDTITIPYNSNSESGSTPGGTIQMILPGNAATDPRIAAGPIGWFTMTTGSVTDAWAAESVDASTGNYEGASMILSQKGPGPLLVENNYMSFAGLGIHHDDGYPALDPGDITFRRNEVVIPTSRLFWHADTDGARYFSRQHWEVKNGVRILIEGNQFRNCAGGDATPVAACIAITAVAGGKVSDVAVLSNTMTGAGATMLPSATNTTGTLSFPTVRSRFENNIFALDATTYTNPAGVTRGWAFYGGITAAADAAIRRNTVYSLVGDDPAFIEVAGTKYSGYAATDNFFVAHSPGGIRALGVNQCGGLDDGGKDVWECAFPDGVFSGNVVLATYTETTLCARYGGTWADGNCTGGLLAKLLPVDGIANAGFYAAGTDFRRAATSPLLSGAGLSYSGRGVGADVDELRQAQGEIYNIRALSITSTGATIYATVPDSGASCKVGYGTSSTPTTWTWSAANTDASRIRGIALTGLSSATQYHYRLVCAGTYQPATQTFTTVTP